MSLLQVAEISLVERGQVVLQDVSFAQRPGQKLALAGETGSGKSTLLQIVAGLVQPSSGEVRFQERRVKGPLDQLVPGTPGVAYLSQQYELPKFLRVEQVLRYANKRSSEEAQTLYEVCRIDHLGARRTDQLSGGERQRVALARLLLSAPRLLLLDEPFSNLDLGHKQLLKAVMEDIGQRLDITCLLVSHDPQDTLSWADEVLVLQHGRLVQRGTPRQVYQQPVSPYVAALFGDYYLVAEPLARALAAQAGTRGRRGKQLLVRPEQVQLAAAGTAGLPAQVEQVRFFGSYSEVELTLAQGRLRARTSAPAVAPGQALTVALAPGSFWYV